MLSLQPGWFKHAQSDLAIRERRYNFYFEFYVHCNLVYLHTEWPKFLNKRHTSWRRRPDSGTRYDCEGLDLKHDASHSPQVWQSRLAVRRPEAEISQQVRGEEKELHLSHSLSQTEPRSASKRHEGAGGASSSFQEALWNRWRGFKKKKDVINEPKRLVRESHLVWSCTGPTTRQDRDELQRDWGWWLCFSGWSDLQDWTFKANQC